MRCYFFERFEVIDWCNILVNIEQKIKFRNIFIIINLDPPQHGLLSLHKKLKYCFKLFDI